MIQHIKKLWRLGAWHQRASQTACMSCTYAIKRVGDDGANLCCIDFQRMLAVIKLRIEQKLLLKKEAVNKHGGLMLPPTYKIVGTIVSESPVPATRPPVPIPCSPKFLAKKRSPRTKTETNALMIAHASLLGKQEKAKFESFLIKKTKTTSWLKSSW